MPTFRGDGPFELQSFRKNQDIQLLTTHKIPIILYLIEFFNLQDEIAEGTKILLDPATPKSKTIIIALRSKPEKGNYYAYAALLECDLCGVRNGFFAMFKSLSGDLEALTRESTEIFKFLNAELEKQTNLTAVIDRSLEELFKP
jgi:hypothetical protein